MKKDFLISLFLLEQNTSRHYVSIINFAQKDELCRGANNETHEKSLPKSF